MNFANKKYISDSKKLPLKANCEYSDAETTSNYVQVGRQSRLPVLGREHAVGCLRFVVPADSWLVVTRSSDTSV